MKKCQILVAVHKPAPLPIHSSYLPIHVGKALSEYDMGIQGDNTGDHISELNSGYNELTASYWAWKNLPNDVEYVGLSHYRRYFWFDAPSTERARMKKVIVNEAEFWRTVEQTPLDMEKYLGKHDILLVNREKYPYPVEMFVDMTVGLSENVTIIEQVILKQHPEYVPSIARYWQNGNKQSRLGMFVTRRELFDQYCAWLFPILFEVQKHVKMSPFKSNQRMIGYVGELLLYLWCKHNKLKIKYRPVLFFDPSSSDTLRTTYTEPGFALRAIGSLRQDIAFYAGFRSFLNPDKLRQSQYMLDYLKNIEGIEIK